jgi:prevent-host-death family protein
MEQGGAMDITKDIQAMTTFRNHSAKFLRHLRKTKRPLVLTVNGKAAAVVQDAEAYQRLLDLAAEASAAEGIRQGLEDAAEGRTRSAREVLDELRTEYDIPR